MQLKKKNEGFVLFKSIFNDEYYQKITIHINNLDEAILKVDYSKNLTWLQKLLISCYKSYTIIESNKSIK